MAKKIYAVRKGFIPGIYNTWDECKEQVTGFSGAEYKSFSSKEEADIYMNGESYVSIEADKPEEKKELSDDEAIVYVDGSYNTTLNIYGSGFVFLANHERVDKSMTGDDPVMLQMNNVAGETIASQKAVEYAIQNHYKKLTIYHDYTGIAGWANGWKAKEEGAKRYKDFIENAKKELQLEFVKVKAHTGNTYNEIADSLAKRAAKID